MKRSELVAYLDEYLHVQAVKDYGPQGLQVEGKEEVQSIVGMVDSQLPCVAEAISRNADLMMVHHGIFWGPSQPLRGSFAQLVRTYLNADLNLYAVHLALDAHEEVGNNVELARRLGLELECRWGPVNGVELGVLATESEGVKFDYLVDRFDQTVGPPSLVQAHGPRIVHRVAIMSGAGAKEIATAAALGCDAYVTGETSHAQYYDALRYGMNVIFGGHYVTETVGIQALGIHLQEQFDLEFEFVDLPTGL